MVFDGHFLVLVLCWLTNSVCGSLARQSRPLRAALLLGLGLALCTPFPLQAAESYLLRAKPGPDAVQRVRAVLEVAGKLKLNADGSTLSKMPFQVKGESLYEERTLEDSRQRRRDARYYEYARATIEVGQSRQETSLPQDRRLLISQVEGASSTLYSPVGPLTREALELVDIQGSSSVLDRLLPDKKVRVGESWTHDDPAIALLLGLEAVHQNDTSSTLAKVEDSLAVIQLQGTVSGAIGGVSTDLDVKANYNFALKQGRVSWLALSIKETRAIGHAEPGLEATARLRVALAPLEQPQRLNDPALDGLPLDYHPGAGLLDFRSREGAFRFLHTRGWQVMVDRHDVAILRLIEQGDLVAQCNASSLPDGEPNQHLQLKAFEADVRRALGDKLGQIVEASAASTDRGLRVLRTVVSGVVEELPIQWIYYHISDDSGRQAALVFTLEANLLPRFAEADRSLVNSFEFLERPPASTSPNEQDATADRAARRPAAAPAR